MKAIITVSDKSNIIEVTKFLISNDFEKYGINLY